MAPTGAQENEMLISVCLMKTCLEHAIFIFWPQILQEDFRMTSVKTYFLSHASWVLGLSHVSLMSFSAWSLSRSIKYFVLLSNVLKFFSTSDHQILTFKNGSPNLGVARGSISGEWVDRFIQFVIWYKVISVSFILCQCLSEKLKQTNLQGVYLNKYR